MWTLDDIDHFGGRRGSRPHFLEAAQQPLSDIASKYGLSADYSRFPGTPELLWCSGIVASDFVEDTGDEQIDEWRGSDSESCWDINISVDEVEQKVVVNFEGRSLLRHARGESAEQLGSPKPKPLELGSEVGVAATRLAGLLDGMLGSFLKQS